MCTIRQPHSQMTRRIYTKSFTVVISGEEAGPAYNVMGDLIVYLYIISLLLEKLIKQNNLKEIY